MAPALSNRSQQYFEQPRKSFEFAEVHKNKTKKKQIRYEKITNKLPRVSPDRTVVVHRDNRRFSPRCFLPAIRPKAKARDQRISCCQRVSKHRQRLPHLAGG